MHRVSRIANVPAPAGRRSPTALTPPACRTKVLAVFGVRVPGATMFGAALCLGAALGGAGCQEWAAAPDGAGADPQQPGPQLFRLGQAGEPPPPDQIVVVQMQFDVLRVELPADQIHHSEKTWNYVDELGGDPTRAALLRRNGFRMGTATADSWPALRVVFEACDARVLRATHVVRRGSPLTLELDSVDDDEPVFLLTADNRLVGRTLDRGEKYLHLDYAFNLEGEGVVTIEVTPEIHTMGRTEYRQGDRGEVRRVRPYEGMVFHELSNTLNLAAGEFLVIGPDTTSSTGLTVGRRFLTRTHEGRVYETVLCITPQPFRPDLDVDEGPHHG
jgi:hypothetical protein